MNQHNSSVGSFDPNKNEYQMTHMVYDSFAHQSQHHVQQQPSYVMQGYEIVDSSDYLMDNHHQALNQPLVSYGGIEYSNSQQVSMANIPSYYDPNPSVMQNVYEQPSPVAGAAVGHQQYYVNSGVPTNQGGYVYYNDQGGDAIHIQNQYGQMEEQRGYCNVGNIRTGMMSNMNSMMGHVQQVRPQPMTAEQIQLSQQRLLGIAPPPRSQSEQLQPQVQMQQLQQPQMQHRQLQAQLQTSIPQTPVPPPAYGSQTYTSTATTTTTTAAHGSPAGSSYTSSGTDISDEGDDLFGAPSPYKRSPPADAAAKQKGKKRKLQKDPNEPQKPVSAYALFFRDTQAAIKGQNPSASFGDVSKIVASMWDNLDKEGKEMYKQKTEVAKKDYLKQLAAYRANLLSKGNRTSGPAQFPDCVNQQQHLQKSSQQNQSWLLQSDTLNNSSEIGGKTLASLISEPKPQQVLTATTTSVILQQTSLPARGTKQEYSSKPEPGPAAKPDGVCIRPGCANPAVECSQWDGEYCTDECVSKNCRDIFTAWVQSKQKHEPTEAIAPS